MKTKEEILEANILVEFNDFDVEEMTKKHNAKILKVIYSAMEEYASQPVEANIKFVKREEE